MVIEPFGQLGGGRQRLVLGAAIELQRVAPYRINWNGVYVR